MPEAVLSPRPALTSLRQRYDTYRAREINFYKEVVSRRTIMQVADRALERLDRSGDLVLHELTLDAAVNEIIAERLRLPDFRRWSRAQGAVTSTRRRTSVVVEQLALPLTADSEAAPVLLLQVRAHDTWEAVVATGGRVLVVEPEAADRARVLERAVALGRDGLVRVAASYDDIDTDERFSSVCYTPAACADYADWEVEAMIESLKERTVRGGVHVVEGLLHDRAAAPRAVLRRGYGAWTRQVHRGSREWTLVASAPMVA